MKSERIDITGLNRAQLLAALYNKAQAQGMGYLHLDKYIMTDEEAHKLIDYQKAEFGHLYFDYVKGRSMKINLGGDTLDPRFYDRDNGQGAVAAIVEQLRKPSNPFPVTDITEIPADE